MSQAAFQGHVELVQCLVEAGAEKDLSTDDGTTPLTEAARWDHVEVVRYLLEAGADKNKARTDVVALIDFLVDPVCEAILKMKK